MEGSQPRETFMTARRFQRSMPGPQLGDWVRCACGGCGAHRYAAMRMNGPSGHCSVCKSDDLLPVEAGGRAESRL